MNSLRNSLLVLALGTLSVGAFAQTSTSGAGPGVNDPNHPRVNEVNKREENQQDRISQGIKSGQLTPGEAANLEKREQGVVNQEQKDMAKDNGHLTKRQQRQLNRKLNRDSKAVYRDKHNAKRD